MTADRGRRRPLPAGPRRRRPRRRPLGLPAAARAPALGRALRRRDQPRGGARARRAPAPGRRAGRPLPGRGVGRRADRGAPGALAADEDPADLGRRLDLARRWRRPPARRGSSPRTGALPTWSTRCAWSRSGWRCSARADEGPPHAVGARARGAGGDRRRGDQPRDRRAPLPLPTYGQGAHELDLSQARRPQPCGGRSAGPAARSAQPERRAGRAPGRRQVTPHPGGRTAGRLNFTPAAGNYQAMPTALLFPGQGSQTKDMRELVERHAPELIEPRWPRSAPTRSSSSTRAPPTRSRRSSARASPPGRAAGRPAAALLAGHSLGELSALAAAGSIEPAADAVRLAVVRGRLMQEAAERRAGRHAGAARRRRGRARGCRRRRRRRSPTTTARPRSWSRAARARSTTRPPRRRRAACARSGSPVAGAFHTAGDGARRSSRSARLSSGSSSQRRRCPCSRARWPTRSATTAAIRDQLAAALVSPVRWRETARALHGLGVAAFRRGGARQGPHRHGPPGLRRRRGDACSTTEAAHA